MKTPIDIASELIQAIIRSNEAMERAEGVRRDITARLETSTGQERVLREALKPFAAIAEELEPELWDDRQLLFAQGSGVTVAHCRAARAALTQGRDL